MIETRWRKACRSGEEGNCIEMARTLEAVRDSKIHRGPKLNVELVGLLMVVKAEDLYH